MEHITNITVVTDADLKQLRAFYHSVGEHPRIAKVKQSFWPRKDHT